MLPEGHEFQVLPPATPLCQLGQVSQARDSHSSKQHESDAETNWAKTRNALGTEPGTRQVYAERPLPHYPEAQQEAELVHNGLGCDEGPRFYFPFIFGNFYSAVTFMKRHSKQQQQQNTKITRQVRADNFLALSIELSEMIKMFYGCVWLPST